MTNEEAIAASVSGAQAESGMSGREPGLYHVVYKGAPTVAEWVVLSSRIMYWRLIGTTSGYSDNILDKIGPRILPPGEPDEAAALRAAMDACEKQNGQCACRIEGETPAIGLSELCTTRLEGARAALAAIGSGAPWDDPELDATDGAHPAWWRGDDHGIKVTVERLTEALDGKDDGKGVVGYEPLEKLRRRLIAIGSGAGRDALEAARSALEFASNTGRFDQGGIMLDALNKIDRALASPEKAAPAPPAASDLPSEAGREMAEEVRQSAPDFGVPKWLPNSDFSIHLAECFDVMYGMGQAFERAKAILDKPPATSDLREEDISRACRFLDCWPSAAIPLASEFTAIRAEAESAAWDAAVRALRELPGDFYENIWRDLSLHTGPARDVLKEAANRLASVRPNAEGK